MNKFLVIMFLSVVGCESEGGDAPIGSSSTSCTVVQEEAGATIRCPDGSTATVLNGVTPAPTSTATSSSSTTTSVTTSTTTSSTSTPTAPVTVMPCTVVQTNTGATITCGDNVVGILHGNDGAVGPRGLTGATGPVGPIGPMGPMGPVGPVGPMGPVGPEGARGADGRSFDPANFYEATTSISGTNVSTTAYCAAGDILISGDCRAYDVAAGVMTLKPSTGWGSPPEATTQGYGCGTNYTATVVARARCYAVD